MKKILVTLVAFAGLTATAQVKVGTNPTMLDGSAVLEIESANKGVLMPRVALTGATDATTIATPATSLIVYNTATAGTAPNNVTPGFYYWDSAKWRGLITPATGLVTKRVSAAGTKVQTITDPDTPATDAILVTYEDSNGDAINATVKSRTVGASFVVEFASAPPVTAFLSYAFAADPAVVLTGPQGPIGLTGATGATGATGPAGANAIFKGKVDCAGTITQTIANTNVTADAAITVTYEDPAGDLIYTTVKTRSAGADFVVQFAAIPPISAKINYTIVP